MGKARQQPIGRNGLPLKILFLFVIQGFRVGEEGLDVLQGREMLGGALSTPSRRRKSSVLQLAAFHTAVINIGKWLAGRGTNKVDLLVFGEAQRVMYTTRLFLLQGDFQQEIRLDIDGHFDAASMTTLPPRN